MFRRLDVDAVNLEIGCRIQRHRTKESRPLTSGGESLGADLVCKSGALRVVGRSAVVRPATVINASRCCGSSFERDGGGRDVVFIPPVKRNRYVAGIENPAVLNHPIQNTVPKI